MKTTSAPKNGLHHFTATQKTIAVVLHATTIKDNTHQIHLAVFTTNDLLCTSSTVKLMCGRRHCTSVDQAMGDQGPAGRGDTVCYHDNGGLKILYELLLSRLVNLLVRYQVLSLALTRCERLEMPSDGLGFFPGDLGRRCALVTLGYCG